MVASARPAALDERASQAELPAESPRRATPIKWWALLGALCLVLTCYSWARWLLGGHASRVQTGPTAVPDFMVWSARLIEGVSIVLALLVAYKLIVKPWRRHGSLTFDGMLCIALVSCMALQDPLSNYSQIWYTFNSALVNFGCPQCYLPGWQSNADTFPSPILWHFGFYLAAMPLVILALNALMRSFRRRWPQLGAFGLAANVFLVAVPIDLVFEMLYVRTGTYVFPGADPAWSIFPKSYYKFPLYEAVIAGFWYTLMASVRFFRNDRGQSIAERGIERLRTTPRRANALQLLALIGLMNVVIFVGYNAPMFWLAIRTSNEWPQDVIDRSYFTNQTCGPGTDYACPARRIPIPRGADSARVTPEGTFIAPDGVPVQVTADSRQVVR